MTRSEFLTIIGKAYDLAEFAAKGEGGYFDAAIIDEQVDGILMALGLPTTMTEFREKNK